MPVSKQLRQSDADKEAKLKALGESLEKEKKMLADTRQRLSEREMVVAAQTKSIQELADKLRAKETELRAAVDHGKSLNVTSARQAAELQRVESELERATSENNELGETVRRLETAAEKWKTEREELERKTAEAIVAATSSVNMASTDDSEKRALRGEIQQLRDQLTAHDGCSRERARLEREMKMLNETLYSSVAAKNKSALDYKLLQDQLTAERERFAVHERQCASDRERLEADIRKLTGCSGSRRASGDHQTTVVDDHSRSQSDLNTIECQIASARDELAKLMAEKERLTYECATTSERLLAKLSRLKSLQVLCVLRMLFLPTYTRFSTTISALMINSRFLQRKISSIFLLLELFVYWTLIQVRLL